MTADIEWPGKAVTPEGADTSVPPLQARLAAAVRTFGLAPGPTEAFVRGRVKTLDHAPLQFGKRYTVTAAIASNRGDALTVGQSVFFLGADIPSATALALYFETVEGRPLCLQFDGDAPQQADTRRYFRDIEAHLRPVRIDLSKRRKTLTAARAVLLHLRKTGGHHGD